jgi:hypothetical protein
MEVRGFEPSRRQASRRRLSLATPRHQGELLVHNAAAMEHQRVDGVAGRHEPPCRIVLGNLRHDFSEATFVTHARDKTTVIQDVTAGGVGHEVLLSRGDSLAPLK